jgi:hypothetical protein
MTTMTERKVRVHVQVARRRIRQAADLYRRLGYENAAMTDDPSITDDVRARATSAAIVTNTVARGLEACAESLHAAGAGEAELRWYEVGAAMAAQRINDALGYGFQMTAEQARRLLAEANDRLNYAAVLAEAHGAF